MRIREIAIASLLVCHCGIFAQSARPKFDAFEVATIKPVDFDANSGRYIRQEGSNRVIAKNYTLQLLIAAAYDLSSKAVSGGPAWLESDRYDIVAVTPGEVQPTRGEQMAMLRSLLAERFKLSFHREQKDFPIYVLEVAKNGPRLKSSMAASDQPAALISTVYPQRIVLPARNATMAEFTSLLQRAVLDRPVVDKTGLSGRYDFDLQWAPDETQFGGEVPVASSEAPSPPLFSALQEQLGLRLTATRGPVEAMVVDKAERPSSN